MALALAIVSLTTLAAEPKLPPLTTAKGPRLPGKFVWADLVTDDVAATRKFYSQMFGWFFRDCGNYAIGYNDDRPLCGIFHRARPADGKAEPRWFGYISVANVDRAERSAIEDGGRILAAARKMPARGEQAVLSDAEGALFGVVKSSSGDPEDFLAEPGDWIWMELLSRDARTAAEFYRGVGGYEVVANTNTNRSSDYVLVSEGYARATVRTLSSANTRVHPTWLPFVRVKNVGESVARAGQLGGKTLLEPKVELFDGKVAVIADPTGAAIGVLEWTGEELKGAR
jgi:predicted enzyme related to lactoylglutathione lyase